jgi:ferredoxin
MKIDLYYFSGTGNSLHVAKELKKRIPEINLIPMLSLLSRDVIEINADAIGFVFPTYNMMLPVPVIKFLKKIQFNSCSYIFSIVTRAQSPERAIHSVEKRMKKKGKKLDTSFVITMGGNCEGAFVPVFPTEDVFVKLESQLQNKLDIIQKIIINKELYREKDNPPFTLEFLAGKFAAIITPVFLLFGEKFIENINISMNYFSDPECNGCGICELVCLSKKIKMNGNRPEWQQNIKCFMCFSCFNYCPSHSIQMKTSSTDIDKIKRYSDKSRRYHHPDIRAEDIARQKVNYSGIINESYNQASLKIRIISLLKKIITGHELEK